MGDSATDKPAEEQGAGKREIIIRRAAEVFARSGYEGASIADIAGAVGISKPALYHYFRDKQEIYIHIVVHVVRDMFLNVECKLVGVADPIARLRIFMQEHAAFLHRNADACAVAQVGFRDLRDIGPREAALEWRDRYEDCLRDICEAAQRSGAIAVPDVRMAARMVLSLLNWMTLWYRPGGPMPASHFADGYLNMLLDGFKPRSEPTKQPRWSRANARGKGLTERSI